MKNDLSPHSDPAKVSQIMSSAGFTKDSSGYWSKDGQQVTFAVEDPTSYTDYYADAQIIAANLKPLGFNVAVDGVSPDKWNSDLAAGTFSSAIHWGSGGPTAYTQYDNWLDSTWPRAAPVTRVGGTTRPPRPRCRSSLAPLHRRSSRPRSTTSRRSCRHRLP